MSVERYSTRRHRLTVLAATMGGGQTFAERAAAIRARPSLKNIVAKPAMRAAAREADLWLPRMPKDWGGNL